MTKKTIIKKIKAIIVNYGSFSAAEVELEQSPCVSVMGTLVAMAEEFKHDVVVINVYKPDGISSDPIDEYEQTYEELPKDVLEEILRIAENYEVDQEKTIKRCSN
jgi:hypothetical protein